VKRSWLQVVYGPVAPLLLGILAFFAVVGPRAFRPTNIAWLSAGDPSTHYLGSHFFRNSDWTFPVGLNPSYGIELSNAILFSDSNPLLAFLFKPFASILPETFQYFGIWLLACFVLQAWFGWKLVALISKNPAIRALGAGLFVFAPPMIWRLHGHLSLVGHFLILAALYFLLRPTHQRSAAAWTTVLAVAAMAHAYLLAMVALLWLTDLVQVLARRERSIKQVGLELAGIVTIVGLVCWQVGYFSVGDGLSTSGYGYCRMNLASVLDPSGWSFVLKDIPQAKGDYEGFNFLGLGVITLALFGFPVLIAGRSGLVLAARRHYSILVALTGLTLFALSNKISIGSQEFEIISLPEPLLQAANVFRASGRFFWPVFYVLVLSAIFVVVRGYSVRSAILMLTIALVVQVVDTRAGWQDVRKKLMASPKSEWASPLSDPFWEKAADKYKKVRWIPPGNHSPHWKTLAYYAARHEMKTDAVYLARIDKEALQAARQNAIDAVNTGTYEPDSLYVVDPATLRAAMFALDRETDLLAKVDGLYVIAPGWKRYAACDQVDGELQLEDIVPPVHLGERIEFFQQTKWTYW